MSNIPLPGAPRAPKGRRWKKVRYAGRPELSACLRTDADVPPERAIIRNLSGFGISLFLEHDVEPGTFLVVELVNGTNAFHCAAPMRVVSSRAEAGEQFLVEGAFSRELRNAELQGLLPEVTG
jgi:hypothetical protein